MISKLDPLQHFYKPVIPASNLSIFVGGLVVMNMKTELEIPAWQGVFLDNIPHHPLGINVHILHKRTRTGHFSIPLGTPEDGRSIKISGLKTKPRKTTVSQTADQHLSNINDFSLLHGLPDKPVVPVKFCNPNGDDKAKLTKFEIDGGVAYTARFAQRIEGYPDKYRFTRHSPPPMQTPWRRLGTWIGFDHTLKTDKMFNLTIMGSKTNVETIFTVKEDIRICIVIDNMCDETHCSSDIDFENYYRSPSHSGIVCEEPISLEYAKKTVSKDLKRPARPKNLRIACNAMMVSEIEGGGSLFDLA